MKIEISGTFTIRVALEGEFYVGTVLENDVSSYGRSEREALEMTTEALDLWMESQLDFRARKLTGIIDRATKKAPQPTYTVNYSDAGDVHLEGNHKAPETGVIRA